MLERKERGRELEGICKYSRWEKSSFQFRSHAHHSKKTQEKSLPSRTWRQPAGQELQLTRLHGDRDPHDARLTTRTQPSRYSALRQLQGAMIKMSALVGL